MTIYFRYNRFVCDILWLGCDNLNTNKAINEFDRGRYTITTTVVPFGVANFMAYRLLSNKRKRHSHTWSVLRLRVRYTCKMLACDKIINQSSSCTIRDSSHCVLPLWELLVNGRVSNCPCGSSKSLLNFNSALATTSVFKDKYAIRMHILFRSSLT